MKRETRDACGNEGECEDPGDGEGPAGEQVKGAEQFCEEERGGEREDGEAKKGVAQPSVYP